MQIYTVETLSGRHIKEGELLHASIVLAANLLRDAREAVTNAVGGKMLRYERLLDRANSDALELLKEKAAAAGYDGVLAVRISNPFMVQGSAAVTVYGTGFTFLSDDAVAVPVPHDEASTTPRD
ncbi:heavy metal-binding domain-containing protein [Rhodomicrobium vannielii ATCC 17100]|uniref:YbjQ family protein n=1 Tax=Rhodomicrobium vannielii TaxID=1069 RepID=UPI0019198D4A|nr:heavy metal-binding domain-containing protein [Rhodomicrobium vannielii]MBJ7534973.1 heavy metal-binding domain-containing protein [Rhodomicrobium vannielii ATCC 17100]